MNNTPKVAIIGSGISSLTSAYFLNQKYDIKLYEKNDYLGGHSNTIDIDYNGKNIAVDIGFIVFNHQTYPNLKAFFELLNIPTAKSQMSFAVKILEKNLEYAGTNLNSVFAQRKNIFNPFFLKMLRDILHFNKSASNLLNKKVDLDYNMNDFLKDLRVGNYFSQYYLLPMASAIWSTPLEKIGDYPAQSFVRFFKNHGLLTVSDQPQWFTVEGGSKQYVNKICENFSNKISLNDEVKSIEVLPNLDSRNIKIISAKGEEFFDKVIIGAHSDQALNMLVNPTDLHRKILGNIKYQSNLVILHKDSKVMPENKKAWASWVYTKYQDNPNSPNIFQDSQNSLAVSYWMNNLQNIDHKYPLFVSLNPKQEIAKEDIFHQKIFEHPVFDSEAIKAQSRIQEIQGMSEIYFCGAYQSYGFHEDGISSALRILNQLYIKAPWQ
ncbi:MAG: NAD(P)/FAD-dependent oxidoreductase [Rickettsiales bacterium]